MTFTLLGTGAADGIPPYMGGGRVAEYARLHGGKDIRSRSGAILDDLKLDLPPETRSQLVKCGLDADDWTALLFTHSDEDHFQIAELQYALYPFCDRFELGFTIYGNLEICRQIRKRYPDWPIEVVETRNFHPFRHGSYQITPIEARHKSDEEAHNYFIERDGRSLLYATDTGQWLGPTWDFLRKVHIDLMVIECTEGLGKTDYDGHLNAEECIDVTLEMRKLGVLGANAVVVTTHHSHQGDATHGELEAYLSPHGITVGYDGWTYEL